MMKSVNSKRILAKDVIVSNNTWITGINNNDLIVGPSGGGKTRGYVEPNLIHAADSLIVADTKGNLCRRYGDYLRGKGYKVMQLDFTDTAHSQWGYNPIAFIRECNDPDANKAGDFYDEQDVMKVADSICPIQSSKDPFWDQASKMYLEALILYVLNNLPGEYHDLYEVYTLLTRIDIKDAPEVTNMLLEECITHPDSAFARRYRMIQQNIAADKMHASIKGILAQHLNVVSYAGMRRMFRMDQQVDMEEFLRGKVALFLNVSDSDRSQDAIVNLFYTQALQYLMNAADKSPDSRLPIPVRFILDDFSTNTVIPNFDKIISVIRSREIYVSLIIQSISQLEGLYDHSKAQTIINNCDHCLYLGGTDVETAEYFSKKIDRRVATVLNMPLDRLYLFTRGCEAKEVRKYDLEDDAVYRKLMKRAASPERCDDDAENDDPAVGKGA